MNQVRGEQPQANPTLSDAELRAAIYFAVGVTSESGNKAYRLVVAGDRPSTPRLEPADNSGYSIGTIQTDLGQHYQPNNPEGENVPRDLVNAYQAWARRERPRSVLTEQEVERTVADLGRNGNQIRAQNGRPLDGKIKSNIDAFLASDAGITWVHDWDVEQVGKLMREVVPALRQSDVYRNASLDDQVRLAAMVTKAYNQNENLAGPLLERLRNNRYESLSDVNSAIDGLSRPTGDYFESGRDRALQGADVVNALRNANPASPMQSAWTMARDHALTNPTQLDQQPDGVRLGHAYATVRELFVQYDQAPDFVRALDRGGTFALGKPSPDDKSRFIERGMYAAGDDFVVWNASGKGHAYVGGEWQSIDRSDLVRTAGPRNVTDIDLNTPAGRSDLLRVDPNAPRLRPTAMQAEPGSDAIGQALVQNVGSPLQNVGTAVPRPAEADPEPAQDPMLRQAQEAVRRLDSSLGRDYDEHSARLAASAACLVKANRLSAIDHIVLSDGNGMANKGENLFVVQGTPGDPAGRWAYMKTQEAVTTPVETSMAQLQALGETQRSQAAPSMEVPEGEPSRPPRAM